MANYNDRYNDPDNYHPSFDQEFDDGRFTMRPRGNRRPQTRSYKNNDSDDLDELAGNYGYGRDHEDRSFHIKEDKDSNRWHGNYSSDRAYQNGYYGRSLNYNDPSPPRRER